jgi:hypothetical protein
VLLSILKASNIFLLKPSCFSAHANQSWIEGDQVELEQLGFVPFILGLISVICCIFQANAAHGPSIEPWFLFLGLVLFATARAGC